RQLRDLFFSQNVAERRAIWIRVSYLRFFFDVDIDFDRVDLECDFLLMLTSAEIDLDVLRLKSHCFDAQLITTSRHLIEPHFAALVGRVERLRLSISYQLHLRLVNQRARGILHDHFEARGRSLAQAWPDNYQQSDKHTYRARMER